MDSVLFLFSKAGIYYLTLSQGRSLLFPVVLNLDAMSFNLPIGLIHELTHAQHVVVLPIAGVYPYTMSAEVPRAKLPLWH